MMEYRAWFRRLLLSIYNSVMYSCLSVYLSNFQALFKRNGNTSGTRVFILITRVSNFVENPGLTRVLETRGPSLVVSFFLLITIVYKQFSCLFLLLLQKYFSFGIQESRVDSVRM